MHFLSAQKQGTLYAISAGLCYGFIGYFGMTLINSGLSIFNMLFWRFFIATVFTLILFFAKYKKMEKFSKEKFQSFLSGMIFYGTSTIVYFIASQYIGTGLSMVIFFSFPAMVVLLNIIFYKTKIHKVYYIAFPLLTLGLVCLSDIWGSATVDILGIVFGLLSAALYACYIFSSKHVVMPPIISALMVSAGCMTTCLIASIMDTSFYIPTDMGHWLQIVCMGVLCTGLPILLFLQALRYISSDRASILSVLESVFVVVWGILLLDEKITMLQVIGIVIVLSGALITIFSDNFSKNAVE